MVPRCPIQRVGRPIASRLFRVSIAPWPLFYSLCVTRIMPRCSNRRIPTRQPHRNHSPFLCVKLRWRSIELDWVEQRALDQFTLEAIAMAIMTFSQRSRAHLAMPRPRCFGFADIAHPASRCGFHRSAHRSFRGYALKIP